MDLERTIPIANLSSVKMLRRRLHSGHCHLCFFLLPIDIPRLTPLPHFIDRSPSLVHIITHAINKNKDKEKFKKNVFGMFRYRFKEKIENETSWACFGQMTPF